jgi:hypothetical protein
VVVGLCAVAALATAGCSRAPSVSDVGDKTATYASSIVRKGNVASQAAQAMSSFTALENGLGPLGELLGGSLGTAGMRVGQQAQALVRKGTPYVALALPRRSSVTAASLRAQAEDGSGAGDTLDTGELEQYLRERVFTESNHEGDDGSAAIFRLEGQDVCPYTRVLSDGSSEERLVLPAADAAGFALDAGCVAAVDALEVRIEASEQGDGLDLTLLIGPRKAGPFTLELRPTSLALVVDLGGIQGALSFLQTSGVGADAELPGTFEGTFDVKVAVLREVGAEVEVELSSSVRKAIRVESGDTSFHTAAKSPWVKLVVDDIDEDATALLDLGQTTASAPNDQTGEQETVVLGGASFTFAASEGQTDDFAFTNVGLGDVTTRLTIGSRDALRLDVNPDSGRRFDLRFRSDATLPDRTHFTLEPGLVVNAFMDESVTTPGAAGGITYRWSFTAPSGPPAFLVWDAVDSATGTTLEYVKVLNGTLEVTDGTSTVTVGQGGCLQEADGSGPELVGVRSGLCE